MYGWIPTSSWNVTTAHANRSDASVKPGVCQSRIEGMTTRAVARKGRQAPPALVAGVQQALDDFADHNAWPLLQRELFVRLRLQHSIGCSPTALRGVMQALEKTGIHVKRDS